MPTHEYVTKIIEEQNIKRDNKDFIALVKNNLENKKSNNKTI